MAFKCYVLINILLVILVDNVRSGADTRPEILIDTLRKVVTAFKGQTIELICLASTTSYGNDTKFYWVLPEVEEYMEEDRKKRIEFEEEDFGDTGNVKILKVTNPSIKYQDRGLYICVGNYLNGDYIQSKGTLVVVEEHTGFAPAIWILIGFLLMTCVSVSVIFVWEWRGIAKGKREEDDPINTVQF